MANIKNIDIIGVMPFDAGNSPELLQLLGRLSLPSCNIHFNWEKNPCEMMGNEYGGQTAMYRFHMTGYEALSWGWFDYFKQLIELVYGRIETFNVIDPEDQK